MNQIIAWDHLLFRLVNTSLANPWFDILMPLVRYAPIWAPLYVFLAVFLVLNFKRNGFYIILFGILAVVASDQFCASLIKPLVHRLRPCYDMDMRGQVRLLLDSCGGQFSFPSNHASNHFAIAVFLVSMLPKKIKWAMPVLIVWAVLVSFAQVYVGVHFPLDVICGAIIGTVIGSLFAGLCKGIAHIDLDKEMEEEA